jgi:mannose-6-phosphate isomerase-like protein (cupin superfamily)
MLITPPRSTRHGAELTFETVDESPAPLRVHADQDTLLRVIAGFVALTEDGRVRLLGPGGEAIVRAGTPHRLESAGGEARVLMGFR